MFIGLRVFAFQSLRCVFYLFVFLSSDLLLSQFEVTVPQNVYNREKISLDGQWDFFVDRYEAFFYDFVRVPFDSVGKGRDFAAMDGRPKDKTDRYEYGFDGADKLNVPGDWNSQKKELLYYEGSIWYRKLFQKPKIGENLKLLLYFGAANYRADVYINGKKAGFHIGGFTPFAFDISSLIKPGENSLVVRVDNKRDASGVPTDVTDWWNYGGITRSVFLLPIPKKYIARYQLQLDTRKGNTLSGFLEISQKYSGPATISCEGLSISFQLEFKDEKRVLFEQKIPSDFQYWEPENPRLYEFSINVEKDGLKDQIGLRTINTKGNKLLLNGKPIFLRGICAHEENPIEGRRNHSKTDAIQLFDWAKKLNANYMRLAHYPHNEHMPRLADSLGILLWEEIPVYWTIDWKNEDTYALAEQQLTELVERDRNRASVIIWSMANETPNIPERLTFLKRLVDKARQLDKSRLLSAALFKQNLGNGKYTIGDPFAEFTDVVSFNEYLGWYEGTPDILANSNFNFSSDKPVIVSEFGAGAKYGLRGDEMTRWSEDYQNYLYRETLKLLDRMPNLAGFSPWILADFRSPRRQFPKIQDGWNRKGLVSQEGEFKKAFFTLKDYYNSKKENHE